MANPRKALSGRRGWTAVVGLSTVLTVLVAGQLPAASAADRPLAPVAGALGVLVPSLGPSTAPRTAPAAAPSIAPELRQVAAAPAAAAGSRSVTTSAADRLAGPIRATALRVAAPKPAAAPAKAAPAQAAPAQAAPAQAAPVRASVAKPAAAAGRCSGDGWQARRGQAALDSLRPGAAARTGFRIEFKGARKGYMGLTHLQERRIELFVRACGTQSDELLRHVMAHELGHAYDTVRMSAAQREAWKAVRGISAATPWYGCSACTDFATPAGDFAEVYAQWARGASSNRSELAGDVGPAALAALAARFFAA